MKLTSTVAKSGGSEKRDGSSVRMSVSSIETILITAAQEGMKLIAADIDRIDAPRAALQQHLGKPAGRGADIEADAVR